LLKLITNRFRNRSLGVVSIVAGKAVPNYYEQNALVSLLPIV
jgi:hypothetical protein